MKEIGTKMNGFDLRLEVVSRSCQRLRDIRRWISRKPLEIEAWFQIGPPIGNGTWAIKWSRDRWRHVTLKGQTRDPNNCLQRNISKRLDWLDSESVPKNHQ